MLSRSRSVARMLACGLGIAACPNDRGESAGASTTTASAGSTGSTTGEPTTAATDASADGTGFSIGRQFCREVCQADAHCTMAGVNVGFICQGARCIDPGSRCSFDTQCWATPSGWTTPCASQAECPGQVCIDIGGGAGRCATVPSDVMPCSASNQQNVVLRAIEGDQQITVCANTERVCDDSVCRNPCEDDLSCPPSLPHCNVDTGECECTSDEQCSGSGVAGWARCDAGVCGCSADKDCAGHFNTDACIEGRCGCSSVAVCTIKSFDGTTPLCEPD